MNLDQKIENLYRPSNRITTRIIHAAIPHGAIREIERVIGLETDEYFKIEADDLSMEYIFEYSEIICVVIIKSPQSKIELNYVDSQTDPQAIEHLCHIFEPYRVLSRRRR